jgi:imidazole glycerol phosphate synthase subunit HisF
MDNTLNCDIGISKFIKKTAESNFIPLTVGGGIKNLNENFANYIY